MSANGKNPSNPHLIPDIPASVQADIALLRALLKDDALTGDTENPDDPNLEELLQRLETADGIARGVEGRLDDVITHLDGLLESLEAQVATPQGGAVVEETVTVVEEGSVSLDGSVVEASEVVGFREASK